MSFRVVDFTIRLEASTWSAYFLVDGHLVFQVEGAAPFPQQITLTIGMVTIRRSVPAAPGPLTRTTRATTTSTCRSATIRSR